MDPSHDARRSSRENNHGQRKQQKEQIKSEMLDTPVSDVDRLLNLRRLKRDSSVRA